MHKERQFSCLHQLRQQKSIFGPERGRIKNSPALCPLANVEWRIQRYSSSECNRLAGACDFESFEAAILRPCQPTPYSLQPGGVENSCVEVNWRLLHSGPRGSSFAVWNQHPQI